MIFQHEYSVQRYVIFRDCGVGFCVHIIHDGCWLLWCPVIVAWVAFFRGYMREGSRTCCLRLRFGMVSLVHGGCFWSGLRGSSSCCCTPLGMFNVPLTLLGPQSRFGDKILEIWSGCPQHETAVVLKGLIRSNNINNNHELMLHKQCRMASMIINLSTIIIMYYTTMSQNIGIIDTLIFNKMFLYGQGQWYIYLIVMSVMIIIILFIIW